MRGIRVTHVHGCITSVPLTHTRTDRHTPLTVLTFFMPFGMSGGGGGVPVAAAAPNTLIDPLYAAAAAAFSLSTSEMSLPSCLPLLGLALPVLGVVAFASPLAAVFPGAEVPLPGAVSAVGALRMNVHVYVRV